MAMKMTKVELVKLVEELQAKIAGLKGEVADLKAKSESLEDSDITGESTSNLGTSSDSEEPTTSDEEFINDSSESDSIESEYVLSVTFENEKQKETIKITVDAEEYDDFDEDDIEGLSDWIENKCLKNKCTLDWSDDDDVAGLDMDWEIVR